MLLLLLVSIACRGQARGDEPRAERARHGRHCPPPLPR
uniref:Pco121523 n=1 Tax=Arundo donax TaxID=35708 RepID=A0A0A9DVA5_ARUDO